MIDAQTIDRIAATALQQGLDESTVRALRAAWPGMHISYCMDDEICGVEPVRELQGLNLYLVDGREHCMSLTGDALIATGLLLAEVEPDNE
jgi:Family of unknown function (DUF6129)